MTLEEKKRLVREARVALGRAKCTCDGKHDPFWVGCPRTLASIAHDDALAIAGFVR